MFKYDNNTLPESISELFVPNTAIHTIVYHVTPLPDTDLLTSCGLQPL